MKITAFLTATAALALPLNNDDVPEGALLFPVKRTTIPVSEENRLKVRADHNQAIEDKITNQKYYYSSNIKIGTPPQAVDILIDTGSSDTWVMGPNTKFNGQGTLTRSFFDSTQSSTWAENGTQFEIKYGIGHTVGKWGTDVIEIAGAKVKDMSVGIADNTDVRQGIVGIGRPQAEITIKDKKMYANLPQKLFESGVTKSPAYSLYLNEQNSDSGSILFGAVDHSKYTGKLQVYDISHSQHYGIPLKGLSTDSAANNILDKPMTAILDSGTTLSYFPDSVTKNVLNLLKAQRSFALNNKYYADCNVTDHLTLDFGKNQIQVPNYQFLQPIEQFVNPLMAQVMFPRNTCFVGFDVVPEGMDFILLGDNTIRSAYIVYDPQNKQIAVAQAKFGDVKPNIELILNSRIPGVVGGK